MKTICRIIFVVAALSLLWAHTGFSEDEIQYKKFDLENATCDVGVMYDRLAEGMTIGVSAIALGHGAEFRKWKVSDIRLSIADEKIKPSEESKFYTKKESFIRVPAAVLFAAIGTQIHTEGSQLQQGVAKAGMALGMGLLVLQAKGEIAGDRAIFRLNKETVDKIAKGKDAIEITVENEGLHTKYKIKIGIAKLPITLKTRFDYEKMSREELLKAIDILEGQVMVLEKNRDAYKYGTDPEYDEIQRKIEKLEAERGMAYKIWFEKQSPGQN